MTDARVSQLSRQVLRDGPGSGHVAQIARGVLRDGPANARVAGLSRQVLRDGPGSVHVAQFFRTILRSERDSPYPNFPVRLFAPPSLTARIEGGAIVGGVSASGDQSIEAMDAGGRWVMEFGETPLWDRDKVHAWRSFVAGADMGAMGVVIPLWDRLYGPYVQTSFTGSTTFGQVVWRDTPVWEADEIQAAVTADVQQHATEATFSFAGGQIVGGEHFSIYGPRYGWRLYRLIRRTAIDDGGAQTWAVRPPLREWAGAGTPLNFDTPRCTMRCDGDIDAIVDMLRFGRGTPRFVETFNRYP